MCQSGRPLRVPVLDTRPRSIIETERRVFARYGIREIGPPRVALHDPPEVWQEIMRKLNPKDRK